MPTVTKIKPQKKKERYNIYLDGKFAFGLDAESLVKSGIAVGDKLSDGEVTSLIYTNEVSKLMNKALRFLSYRPRSERETRQYLGGKVSTKNFGFRISDFGFGKSRGKIKDSFVEDVIEKLKGRGYIDDLAFAQWWMEQRRGGKVPMGGRRIRAELYAKGVSREITEEVLNGELATRKHGTPMDIGDTEIRKVTEVELAMKAAQKKIVTYGKLEPLEFKQKMGSYLARQGFDWETIKSVIDTLEKIA